MGLWGLLGLGLLFDSIDNAVKAFERDSQENYRRGYDAGYNDGLLCRSDSSDSYLDNYENETNDYNNYCYGR